MTKGYCECGLLVESDCNLRFNRPWLPFKTASRVTTGLNQSCFLSGPGFRTEEANCSKPAIEEFPGDFFTPEQRNKGGIVVHIIIATYLILALAIICDDFFVPVLEIICDSLHLSSDVAGATFMAAGMSTVSK